MTDNKLCDVAVIGLGVMGANLARNFASRGLRVAGYTLIAERIDSQGKAVRSLRDFKAVTPK